MLFVSVQPTSRDSGRGGQAVKTLQKEVPPIYITDDKSVEALHDYMKDNHGGIDILVNNAGFAFKNDSNAPFAEQAQVTVETNFGGTRKVCRQLFPLLRQGARVVNVTSNCGHLSKIKGDEPAAGVLRDRLSRDELTEGELVKMMEQFVKLAKEGEHVKSGWPNSAYKVSKVGVSALTIIQQRVVNQERAGEDIVINHAHPG
jgi:carbonyl reductase 1